MSLLSDMGIPPGDELLAEIAHDDDMMREEMERHACPDCGGYAFVAVFKRTSPTVREMQGIVPCPTCEGSGSQEGSHTVAGQGQGG